jgi:hypothetical protein
VRLLVKKTYHDHEISFGKITRKVVPLPSSLLTCIIARRGEFDSHFAARRVFPRVVEQVTQDFFELYIVTFDPQSRREYLEDAIFDTLLRIVTR